MTLTTWHYSLILADLERYVTSITAVVRIFMSLILTLPVSSNAGDPLALTLTRSASTPYCSSGPNNRSRGFILKQPHLIVGHVSTIDKLVHRNLEA